MPPLGAIVGAVAALAAVLGLIWGMQWLARLRLRPSGNRRLQLNETIALDARRRVHLVRCDGRCLLIATGGAQDLMLGWLPEE